MNDKAIEAAAFDKAMMQAPCGNPQDCTTLPWKCSGCIEAQREFLAAYEAALWRPIEEAPKDGTRIIIGWNDPDTNPQIAIWSDAKGGHWFSIYMPGFWFDNPKIFRLMPSPPEP